MLSPALRYSLFDRLQQQDEDICAVRHNFASERQDLQTQLRVQAQRTAALEQETDGLRQRLKQQDDDTKIVLEDLHKKLLAESVVIKSQSDDIAQLQQEREELQRDLHVQLKRVEVLITERDDLTKQKLSSDDEIGDLSRHLARLREELRAKDQHASRASERFMSTRQEMHDQIEKLKGEVDSGSRLTKNLSEQMAAIEQNSDLRAAKLQVQLALCQCEMDEKQLIIDRQNSSKRSYNEVVKQKMALMEGRVTDERTSKLKVMQAFRDVRIRIHRLQFLYGVFRAYYESHDPVSFSPVSVLEASVAYRGFWVKFDELRVDVDKTVAET